MVRRIHADEGAGWGRLHRHRPGKAWPHTIGAESWVFQDRACLTVPRYDPKFGSVKCQADPSHGTFLAQARVLWRKVQGTDALHRIRWQCCIDLVRSLFLRGRPQLCLRLHGYHLTFPAYESLLSLEQSCRPWRAISFESLALSK